MEDVVTIPTEELMKLLADAWHNGFKTNTDTFEYWQGLRLKNSPNSNYEKSDFFNNLDLEKYSKKIED